MQLLLGDCREVLKQFPDNHFDSVVTDPPYGLEFMGKDWDRLREMTTGAGKTSAPGIGDRTTEWPSNRGWNTHRCRTCGHLSHGGSPCRCTQPDFAPADNRWQQMQDWYYSWAVEVYRVLKPGAHLLAFGGTRTYHRMTCAIEDAGFEIRDCLQWLYGTGFPKSMNLDGEWQGWGTALKPACEPIVLARKPLVGTVAKNVQQFGTGALHIDACRIAYLSDADRASATPQGVCTAKSGALAGKTQHDGDRSVFERPEQRGRWPANVVLTHHPECTPAGTRVVPANGALTGSEPSEQTKQVYAGKPTARKAWTPHGNGDGTETVEAWDCHPDCPVKLLDEQSGVSKSSGGRVANISKTSQICGGKGLGQDLDPDAVRGDPGFGDIGGASRFFYVAKASKSERNTNGVSNTHPTVKPVALLRWLIRLVTPPSGTVLDPFLGSGSTGLAAREEGVELVGIELSPDYLALARQRLGLPDEAPVHGGPPALEETPAPLTEYVLLTDLFRTD